MIDFSTVVPKFDAILSRGLCAGVGIRTGSMCIEAAICAALDEPHGDRPSCVHSTLRDYKIRLNDAQWSSPTARATGLRRLGILQLGTAEGFDSVRFAELLSIRTVRDLLSDLLERIDPMLYAAQIVACRAVTTRVEAQKAAVAAADAAYAADAADAAAAYAAASAKSWTLTPDYYLLMSARIAETILMEMQTPGAVWLAAHEE